MNFRYKNVIFIKNIKIRFFYAMYFLAPAERARTRVVEPVAAALNAALADTGPEDLLCVAGSLYLVGQVRSLLKPGAAV